MPMTISPPLPDELEQLAGHGAAQAVDAGDTVADLDDGADLADVDRRRGTTRAAPSARR